jgi:8-oxo-dGTP diphosphatase
MASVRIGAFAIILDEQERVLLCHRRDVDLWNLPGGGMEVGETPWRAVVREVREEVCLAAEVVRLAGVYSKPDRDEIVFSFVCRIVGGVPVLTDEADQIGYFAFADLPRNTAPKQVERIQDALAYHPQPVLKVQVGPSSIELINAGKL